MRDGDAWCSILVQLFSSSTYLTYSSQTVFYIPLQLQVQGFGDVHFAVLGVHLEHCVNQQTTAHNIVVYLSSCMFFQYAIYSKIKLVVGLNNINRKLHDN